MTFMDPRSHMTQGWFNRSLALRMAGELAKTRRAWQYYIALSANRSIAKQIIDSNPEESFSLALQGAVVVGPSVHAPQRQRH